MKASSTAQDRFARGALAVASALLAVVATYALLRAYDVLFRTEPNPATVIATAYVAMFWRLGIGAYVGVAAAFGVFSLAGRDLGRVARAVMWAIPVVAALIAIQGVFLP